MKRGDKITFLHKEFSNCGCSSEFNKLEIGKEYTVDNIAKYDFCDKAKSGSVDVISLSDKGVWGGFYPLSLFQPLTIKETIYEIY